MTYSRIISLKTAFIFFPLFVFSSVPFRANAKTLSKSELVDLAVRSSSHDRIALNKLIRECSQYKKRIKKGERLTLHERNTLERIHQILDTLSFQTVWHQDIIQEGLKDEEKNLEELLQETTTYFSFKERDSRVFEGRKKNFVNNQWINNDKVMYSQVSEIGRIDSKTNKIVIFNEIYGNLKEWLIEQNFTSFLVSPEGVRVEKDVVFSQPVEGSFAPVGKQEPYWIFKFPLEIGNIADGYKVTSLNESVMTPLDQWNECLLIRSQVEKYIFAPKAGIVDIEIFDERWMLKEMKNASQIRIIDFPKDEKRLLEKEIDKFCKTNHYKLEKILSLSDESDSASGYKMKEEEKGSVVEYFPVLSRLLVYSREKQDLDQKRFKVIEQTWIKEVEEDRISWKVRR